MSLRLFLTSTLSLSPYSRNLTGVHSIHEGSRRVGCRGNLRWELFRVIEYDNMWYGIAWCDMEWYDVIRHDMMWYCMIWCDKSYVTRFDVFWYYTIWHITMWCDMIWYFMIWFGMTWYDMMLCKMSWYCMASCRADEVLKYVWHCCDSGGKKRAVE